MHHDFYPLKIKDIRPETEDSKVISFEIPSDLKAVFHWKCGQNITIRFYQDGKEQRRSYSINTIPSEGNLEIGVRRIDDGLFSDTVINTLQPGITLDVMPPTGNFVLDSNKDELSHVVFFAAGSGITPIIALIKELLLHHTNTRVTLIYGNRTHQSVMFLEELENLKDDYVGRLQLIHLFSREAVENELFNGRINKEKAAAILNSLVYQAHEAQYYLCGPREMVMEVKDLLISDMAIPERRVHFELFFVGDLQKSTSGTVSQSEEGMSRVTILLDGKETELDLAYDGEVILDAGIDEGLDLPYACKGGVCATCKAKLIKGEVEMDSNFALEQDELDAGYILTCQSHPRTPEVYVNYDY
jgi:ring-1,2-phenylacetyl-CoA epoxidase subunit PaaE